MILIIMAGYSFAQSKYEVVREAKRDGKTYFYFSVDCSDKNNCTAVGHEYPQDTGNAYAIIIERTTDGGATWQFQHSGLPSQATFNDGHFLRKVDAIDSLNVVLAGDGGKILRTTDGGDTWYQQQFAIVAIADISFSDSATGMAVASGAILRTADAGTTWEKVANLPNEWYQSCKAYSATEQKAFVFGRGRVYATSDGWQTWHSGDTLFDDESGGQFWRNLEFAYFYSQQILIAGGAHHAEENPDIFHNALIAISQDGGKSWTEVFDSMTQIVGGVFSIAINSEGRGIALGYGAGVLTTTDYGLHWNPDTLNLEKPPLKFYSATLAGDDEVLFIGQNTVNAKIIKARIPQLLIARTQLENVIYSVRVYPNPASTDQLNISSLQRRYGVTYALYDVLGRKALDIYPDKQNNASVSIAELPIGAYKLFVNVDNLQLPVTTVCIIK